VRWVASQLGHANPELTLRVYAHALREEEEDLGFLDFGGTKRHPRGTKVENVAGKKKPLRVTPRRGSHFLEHETGLEPAFPSRLDMLQNVQAVLEATPPYRGSQLPPP